MGQEWEEERGKKGSMRRLLISAAVLVFCCGLSAGQSSGFVIPEVGITPIQNFLCLHAHEDVFEMPANLGRKSD